MPRQSKRPDVPEAESMDGLGGSDAVPSPVKKSSPGSKVSRAEAIAYAQIIAGPMAFLGGVEQYEIDAFAGSTFDAANRLPGYGRFVRAVLTGGGVAGMVLVPVAMVGKRVLVRQAQAQMAAGIETDARVFVIAGVADLYLRAQGSKWSSDPAGRSHRKRRTQAEIAADDSQADSNGIAEGVFTESAV